jgi:hypothetical protein
MARGIDPGVMPRLFTRFATKSFDGQVWVCISPKIL